MEEKYMNRRALIIYMTDSPSGKLEGPIQDNENLREFLTSCLGGVWYSNEIISLKNPTIKKVRDTILTFSEYDYSFIVFTGHGELEKYEKDQYIELMDGEISVKELITDCPRQTIIIDACRGYFSKRQRLLEKSMNFSDSMESYRRNISTRQLFDDSLAKTEEGITVLYAANENQSALDTNLGAAYISSLIGSAQEWERASKNETVLSLKSVHGISVEYMRKHFVTRQVPVMNHEKRLRYYPFAVKFTTVHG
jgi:hypothetical protein